MDKKILFIIPARKNSKRIKDKNLMPFHGKPLVVHSIETAKASKFPNKLIVITTDSEEIGQVAEQNGAQFLRRPKEFARDLSPDIEWMKHALDILQSQNYIPDYIALLRPTSPLRDPALVDKIILTLIQHPEAECIKTLEQVKNPVEKCEYIGEDGFMKDFFNQNLLAVNQPSQNFKPAYFGNGYIDAWKNVSFSARESIYHNLKVIPFLMPFNSVLDIDVPEDLNNSETP